MNAEVQQLYGLIKGYALDWRHPDKLRRVVRKIERGRMGPKEAGRWLRRIIPWVEDQEIRGIYLPRAGTFDELGLDKKPFDVTLGHLVERPDVPLGIHLSTGVHHTAICGKPLAGKSVALRLYLKRGYEFGVRYPDNKIIYILLDSKNDVPNPEKLFGENFIHVKVRDPGTLRFALNAPPGVLVSPWAAWLCTAIGARIGLIVSRTSLTSVYTWLVPFLNSVPSVDGIINTPSARLILDTLTSSPGYCWGQKLDYIRVLTQMLEALIVDADGMFDAERGFEVVQDVLHKGVNCVISIANFEPAYLRYLICDIIILQLLTYHIHNNLKTTRTRICLACDESDFFVRPSAQAVYPESLSPITILARIAREYGIQICLSVSGLQNVAPYLLTGADCLMMMASVDSESIRQAKLTFGVERGLERLLPSLRPGQCIYRNASTEYPYPMLGQIDFLEPDHSDKQRAYDSIPFRPARGLADLPDIRAALEKRIAERRSLAFRQPKRQAKSPSLTKNQRTFLSLMSLHEHEPLNRLFERIGGLSPATQQKITKRLRGLKLIETEQIRTSKSPLRLGQLTEAGWDYLKDKSKFKPLRGGLVHTHVCRWKQALDIKRGCDECICEFQYPHSPGFCDVGTRINGKLYCTEVVIGCESNICHHVRSCFVDSAGVESLTIVTLLKSEHKKLSDMIMSEPDLVFFSSRIQFVTVDEILKELYEK